MFNCFSDGTVARWVSRRVASTADPRGRALAGLRGEACERFVSGIMWYLEKDDIEEKRSEIEKGEMTKSFAFVPIMQKLSSIRTVPPSALARGAGSGSLP